MRTASPNVYRDNNRKAKVARLEILVTTAFAAQASGPDDPRDGICGECREQRARRNRQTEIDITCRMRSGATVTLAESDRMRERL
jgi:hypothetical protein